MSQILATMTGGASEGARGVEDPQCGRPLRNHSPRDSDDSPPGHDTIKRDRNREWIPSPQQVAQGEDHGVPSLSLGVPLVPLEFRGQAPAAAQAGHHDPAPLGSRIFSSR